MGNNRFKWKVDPIANENCVIRGQNYRFTVLAPALIRMEYDKQGLFEDRASQSVFYRNFKAVDYSIKRKEDTLIIETDKLKLTYKEELEFAEDTLSISLKMEPASTWCFGEDFEELGGTASTLDGINGPIAVGKGICSRNGFSVLDDTDRMVLDEDGWVNVRRKDICDLYFFGHGYDYLEAIKDYYRLTGLPAMLPSYAFGNWWSRYHKYTQEEYIELMERFKEEDIPFSVAIVDMDWHLVDVPDNLNEFIPRPGGGWTGYSWNKELFPDYRAFLKYLGDNNLKTALNLHPADGCRWHEDMYEDMCKASGIDPATKERVPFDILSPKAMQNYFDILLHPYEEDGVNFWWMDWQQGTDYRWIRKAGDEDKPRDEREALNPLWMINHLHVLDIQRNGKRPMFFSRYCGPGSHRYAIGFSGDTHITWESLDFQPYFTATASNIGYSWWSHDIGGHMMGYRDDELSARWLQLGVFSPINRLHCSSNSFMAKEPWGYTLEYEKTMKKYLRLRAELFPYLYSMNYRTHSELEPLIWPMYYTHPKCSAAYEVKNQFWFGSELMVAPITQPTNDVDQLGSVTVWFPKGIWFDFFNGAVYHSKCGRKLDVYRTIDEYPVFAKAGAIVPQVVLASHSNKVEAASEFNITVFPGANNSFTLYEDEGDYNNYQSGKCVKTEMLLDYSEDKAKFTICPAKGEKSLIPEKRKWNIRLRGFKQEIESEVQIDGKKCTCEVVYNKATNTTMVSVKASVSSKISVTVKGSSNIFDNRDKLEKCYHILYHAQLDFSIKQRLYEVLQRKYWHVHKQMEAIHREIPSQNHLAGALKEQLMLEQDEYDNYPI